MITAIYARKSTEPNVSDEGGRADGKMAGPVQTNDALV